MKALTGHRSIRKFKPDPIHDELLNTILRAGIRASTTGNMQLYSIIVTRDIKKRELLAPCHFNQQMVKEAPVLLTFCADINRFTRWCNERAAEPAYNNFLWFVNAATDALLAAQNCCIAAEENGLGICYLGTTLYMADEIIHALALPPGVMPVTTVVMGIPAEEPPLTDRLPEAAVIHYENYNDYTVTTINKLYKEKELLPLTQKLLKENNKQTLAQVFTDNRYKKPDNIKFSQKLLNTLHKQGFMNQ